MWESLGVCSLHFLFTHELVGFHLNFAFLRPPRDMLSSKLLSSLATDRSCKHPLPLTSTSCPLVVNDIRPSVFLTACSSASMHYCEHKQKVKRRSLFSCFQVYRGFLVACQSLFIKEQFKQVDFAYGTCTVRQPN